jgi:hypothetical protein
MARGAPKKKSHPSSRRAARGRLILAGNSNSCGESERMEWIRFAAVESNERYASSGRLEEMGLKEIRREAIKQISVPVRLVGRSSCRGGEGDRRDVSGSNHFSYSILHLPVDVRLVVTTVK